MTLYQFNALDEMEQMEAVWNIGVHIGERDVNQYSDIFFMGFNPSLLS